MPANRRVAAQQWPPVVFGGGTHAFAGEQRGGDAARCYPSRMKARFSLVTALILLASTAYADDPRARITGEYVEARTAEVFAGACIMNSEAETTGRQAVLAWRITSGAFRGVALDGLTMVAAVAGDRNLGMREMGGEEPAAVRAVLILDPLASRAQRDALTALAIELSGGLITDVVRVDVAPVQFSSTAQQIEVSAADSVRLSVNKEMKHDASCGAMQWFKPFSTLEHSSMGVAEAHSFSGQGLGTRWSAPDKRSAFFGTFAY
jgi:hypothetical protein